MHALRGDKFKFIRYQGIWDLDELYDLEEDPLESRNLINNEKYKPIVNKMRERLFDILEETGGMNIPLQRDKGGQNGLRSPDKTKAADFPDDFKKPPARQRQ